MVCLHDQRKSPLLPLFFFVMTIVTESLERIKYHKVRTDMNVRSFIVRIFTAR